MYLDAKSGRLSNSGGLNTGWGGGAMGESGTKQEGSEEQSRRVKKSELRAKRVLLDKERLMRNLLSQ